MSRFSTAIVLSYVAQGQALISRFIASACDNSHNLVSASPLTLVNNKKLGLTVSIWAPGKMVCGSKHLLTTRLSCSWQETFSKTATPLMRAVFSVMAKGRRKLRASTSFSLRLRNNSSSERYRHPAAASCIVSVDLPLPDGPMIITPVLALGLTTAAL